MPIYEFRCLVCNECFEFLIMKPDDPVELRCPKCKSEDFERVLSTTCYTMDSGSKEIQRPRSKTRTCAGGTCTTYDIPGPDG